MEYRCLGKSGLGVVPYSPLARGVLTGKPKPDVPPPPGTRTGRQDRRMRRSGAWRPVVPDRGAAGAGLMAY